MITEITTGIIKIRAITKTKAMEKEGVMAKAIK